MSVLALPNPATDRTDFDTQRTYGAQELFFKRIFDGVAE